LGGSHFNEGVSVRFTDIAFHHRYHDAAMNQKHRRQRCMTYIYNEGGHGLNVSGSEIPCGHYSVTHLSSKLDTRIRFIMEIILQKVDDEDNRLMIFFNSLTKFSRLVQSLTLSGPHFSG
jgi:hypothetical protein